MGLQRWLSVYEHSREDLSLVLSTYMRWFTTICNSSFWGISYPFGSPWVSAYTPADIYKEVHTHKNRHYTRESIFNSVKKPAYPSKVEKFISKYLNNIAIRKCDEI